MKRFDVDECVTMHSDLEKELAALEDAQNWPPSSFEDLEAMRPAIRIGAKAVQCECPETVEQNFDDMIKKVKELNNGIFPKDGQGLHEALEDANRMVADEYDTQRKCHIRREAWICYCDEHGH